MSVSKCVGCNKKHSDFNWTYTTYEDEYGQKKNGWFCTKWIKPSGSKEWVPDRIKDERLKYRKDIVQPFRDGQLSKEYVDTYGTRGLHGVTKDDVKKAKPVWTDTKEWSGSRAVTTK